MPRHAPPSRKKSLPYTPDDFRQHPVHRHVFLNRHISKEDKDVFDSRTRQWIEGRTNEDGPFLGVMIDIGPGKWAYLHHLRRETWHPLIRKRTRDESSFSPLSTPSSSSFSSAASLLSSHRPTRKTTLKPTPRIVKRTRKIKPIPRTRHISIKSQPWLKQDDNHTNRPIQPSNWRPHPILYQFLIAPDTHPDGFVAFDVLDRRFYQGFRAPDQRLRVKLLGIWRDVAKLVYETYIGPIPRGCIIEHIDDNPFNCTLQNLNLAIEWVQPKKGAVLVGRKIYPSFESACEAWKGICEAGEIAHYIHLGVPGYGYPQPGTSLLALLPQPRPTPKIDG